MMYKVVFNPIDFKKCIDEMRSWKKKIRGTK